MKKATFAILFLLSISCFNLLAKQEVEEEPIVVTKPLLHKHTHDGKVLTDYSTSHNHICIYLSNGEKIEKTVLNSGEYSSCYLAPVDLDSKIPHYVESLEPTDRLIITFDNANWSNNYDGQYYNDIAEYIQKLEFDLLGHIIDVSIVYKRERKWNSSNNVWMSAYFYRPLIIDGEFIEEISDQPKYGFSVDPKDIEKIELWSDPE